jgi:hypothetical protein
MHGRRNLCHQGPMYEDTSLSSHLNREKRFARSKKIRKLKLELRRRRAAEKDTKRMAVEAHKLLVERLKTVRARTLNRAAQTIQVAFRTRREELRLRKELSDEENRAAGIIQYTYKKFKFWRGLRLVQKRKRERLAAIMFQVPFTIVLCLQVMNHVCPRAPLACGWVLVPLYCCVCVNLLRARLDDFPCRSTIGAVLLSVQRPSSCPTWPMRGLLTSSGLCTLTATTVLLAYRWCPAPHNTLTIPPSTPRATHTYIDLT